MKIRENMRTLNRTKLTKQSLKRESGRRGVKGYNRGGELVQSILSHLWTYYSEIPFYY
jgi:hypothetical protein